VPRARHEPSRIHAAKSSTSSVVRATKVFALLTSLCLSFAKIDPTRNLTKFEAVDAPGATATTRPLETRRTDKCRATSQGRLRFRTDELAALRCIGRRTRPALAPPCRTRTSSAIRLSLLSPDRAPVPTRNSVCALRSLRDPPIKVFRQRLQGPETELASPRPAAVHSARTTGEYVPVWQQRGAMVRRRAVRNGDAARRRVVLE
jgi:hypothetical protein